MMATVPKILVLVSGGADSVFLFWQCLEQKRLGLMDFSVLHFNHHLRADESDAEASFVQDLCSENAIPFFGIDLKFNRKSGLQNSARQMRYRAAYDLAKSHGIRIIATAHHSDDQLETLVMRKARGTGLKGLCGISHWSKLQDVFLWRPLLQWRKCEILKSLAASQKKFCTDSSNQSSTYFRNRVRKALASDHFDSSWQQKCHAQQSFLRGIDQYFEQRLQQETKTKIHFISKSQFSKLCCELQFRLTQHRAKNSGLIKQWRLKDFFKIQQENQSLNLGPLSIIHDRFGIWFLNQKLPHLPISLHLKGLGAYFSGRNRVKVSIKETTVTYLNLKDDYYISILTAFPLQLTCNDLKTVFLPFARRNSVTVLDFLKQAKVHRSLRPHWPMLKDHNQDVLAIVGLEIAEMARVKDSDVKALCLKVTWPR